MKRHICGQSGFTLVELLVVIAIISVLAALLLPSLNRAVFESRITACMNQHRQLYLATSMYADDNRDSAPDNHLYAQYIADYYGKSIGQGRLLRMGYATPDLYLEPDWINPSTGGDSHAFAYGGNIRWWWLKHNPTVPYLSMNYITGCYTMFHRDNPWNGKPRTMSKTPINNITALFMCRIDAKIATQVHCHEREAANCTYQDGHVRTLREIEIRAAVYPAYDNSNFNFNTASWWTWAVERDKH